ncbi:DENN domain-containing protein 3 isoform X5 [Ailuropoda melanoleuca]|uniref:DENN domain-containing protein 3 isoform X5 n=1 Tax=Ailuropoda melanoleuca TaxID=9646 RepID=UPI001493E8BE|nr:DENN domain-containing protein 3 isoform X5 [Ailuropoda melanoleuca]
MAEAAPQHLALPSGLLELCALLGPSRDSLRGLEQVSLKQGVSSPSSLDPEVLSVFVPPFVSKEDSQTAGAPSATLSKTRRRSFRKKRDKPKTEPWKGLPPEDISVPNGVDLLALPQLCFPGGMYVASEPKEDCVHFLVLTDVCGNRTYAVVAQYYRPLQDESCFYNGKAHWEPSWPTAGMAGCFVPFAVCVVSKLPYYNALKDCLSCLLTHLKLCKDFEVDNHIKDFAAKLSLIPSPPPGPLHLIFNMKPLQIVFPSRADPESPVIDLDLHLPLLCFRPEKVLQILTCLLTEQRVVFFSSSWALLPLVAECFLAYLHPLQWQHTFVPVLSRQMLDFVMAPTSFLMGCHLDYFEEVSKEADGLILINIDNGSVTCSSDEDVDVPDIPLLAAQTFTQRVQSLQLHHELDLAHQGASTDLNGERARRRAWQRRLNCQVQQVALQLLFSVFREVKNHLNYEHRVFNSEEFLKTRAPGDQQFYRQPGSAEGWTPLHRWTSTHSPKRTGAVSSARPTLGTRRSSSVNLFGWMNDTFDQKTSHSETLNGTLASPRRPTIEKMAPWKSSLLHVTHRRMVVSMPNLQDIAVPELPARNSSLRKVDAADYGSGSIVVSVTPKPTYTFKIPEIHFPLVSQCVQAYYSDCVALLSKAMSLLAPDNSALLARYFYLRGAVHLMHGQLLDALLDFQSLYKTDIRIFPADLVRRTVASLSGPQRAQAERVPELRRLISEVVDKPGEAPKPDDRVKNFELPKKHMQLDDFVKRVQESGIVKDTNIIHRLFEALTVVPTAFPKTTSETLKHKINPSAGETLPHAVDVLLYTPGHLDPAEKVADAHPKLWCALNEGKVTVFDASSWTIHQHCFKVGTSKLNCMAMAEQSQVWAGSEDSVIYILNVHSMSCNKQLTDHRSGVTGLAVQHGTPSKVYSCSADGTVLAWNVSSLRVTSRFQLPGGRLSSISLHDGHLWCCTGNSIVVVTSSGLLCQELKISENFKETSASFLSFQLLPEQEQLWTACAGLDSIYVWSLKDLTQRPQRVHLQDCSEVSCMIRVKKQIWVGGTGLSQGKSKGKIYVIDAEKKTVEKELVAHMDTVKTLCSAEDRYVLSGSGRGEGKIAIWKVE